MEDVTYVVSINAIEKSIELGEMRLLDETNRDKIHYPRGVEIEEGIFLCSAPFMSSKGEIVKKKCFICTDNDIVEMEGVGFIEFDSQKRAREYMQKLKKMIEWERF